MTRPDDALARAKEAAERKRAEGVYAGPRPGALQETIAADTPTHEALSEWALLSVDPDVAYSTRRAGAPVTALKRLLMRMLRQYHIELEAQQTRFNIGVATRLRELEERVERLEREPGA